MPAPLPRDLEPAPLWAAFDLIRSVPRCSGSEAAVRDAVIAWAEARSLDWSTDDAGNLVVRVPGTPGREDAGTTVIQGHLDMVCEKNADVDFDFDTQGIDVELQGDWLTARGTTLGADNGIGVAAGMALVDDPDAEHGPLELLMTVDEETGMTGAMGLRPGFITGGRMLNLDTEEEGAVYVGCAGGGDVVTTWTLETDPRPEGRAWYRVEVKGLVGGHSGLDIHENRANAIKCLARVLAAVRDAGVPFRLSRIDGGSKRNAIPRESGCGLCVDPDRAGDLEEVVGRVVEELRAEFSATDPDLRVEVLHRPDCQCPAVLVPGLQDRVLDAILATPSGVLAMSRAVPGLVETSNNIGVISTGDHAIQVVNCSRSSVDSAMEATRRTLRSIYELAGAEVELVGGYPGWQPDMDSPLLAQAMAVHEDLFGARPEIKAVHAGLECGLIGEAYPGLDMISIGPDIRGAHSPDERLSVPSSAVFYRFLKGILTSLD